MDIKYIFFYNIITEENHKISCQAEVECNKIYVARF